MESRRLSVLAVDDGSTAAADIFEGTFFGDEAVVPMVVQVIYADRLVHMDEVHHCVYRVTVVVSGGTVTLVLNRLHAPNCLLVPCAKP